MVNIKQSNEKEPESWQREEQTICWKCERNIIIMTISGVSVARARDHGGEAVSREFGKIGPGQRVSSVLQNKHLLFF